jgi:hypothetical protein
VGDKVAAMAAVLEDSFGRPAQRDPRNDLRASEKHSSGHTRRAGAAHWVGVGDTRSPTRGGEVDLYWEDFILHDIRIYRSLASEPMSAICHMNWKARRNQ